MLISWIIPLYNCEKYIGRCIESLFSQDVTEDNFEIIIVDDESKDNSYYVAQSYQYLHSNITLVRQKHQGVGNARNYGLGLSRGEYVHFVDADDVLKPHAIGALFKFKAEHNYPDCDIIGFTHRNFNESTKISAYKPTDKINIEIYKIYDFCCTYGFRANACDYLFKRNFLLRNNLFFSTLSVGEDVMFMLDIYSIVDAHILYTPLPVYYYFQRMNSASNRMDKRHLLISFNHYCEIHRKVSQSPGLRVYPNEISERCSLAFAQCQAITAILAACLPLGSLKICYDKAYSINLFPIRRTSGFTIQFLAALSKHKYITYFMAYLYRYFYVPVIRNRRLSK